MTKDRYDNPSDHQMTEIRIWEDALYLQKQVSIPASFVSTVSLK